MDVEKARVTGRAERLNAQAASFLTGWTNDVPERLFHGALVSRARMKTSEDEQLQASSSERDSPPAVDPPQRDPSAGHEAPEQDQRRGLVEPLGHRDCRAGLYCDGVRMAP